MANKRKDGNGLWDPTHHPDEEVRALFEENPPKTPSEAKALGVNVYYDEEEDTFVKMRYQSRQPVKNGLKYEIKAWDKYKEMRTRNSNTYRAKEKKKTPSLQEYEDWNARNLKPNYKQAAQKQYQLEQQRRDSIATEVRQLNADGTPANYEHINPLSREGSVEHSRNLMAAPADANAFKSDKVPSTNVLREQGVPQNKQAAIRMDANNVPMADKDQAYQAVMGDISTNPRPAARSLPAVENVRSRMRAKHLGLGAAVFGVGAMLHGGPDAKAAETVTLADGTTAQVDMERNQVIGNEGYGVEKKGGKYNMVERGKGAAGKESVVDAVRRQVASLVMFGRQ